MRTLHGKIKRLVSALLSTHLDWTMARAANFTYSSGIVLISHLLHNLLISDRRLAERYFRE